LLDLVRPTVEFAAADQKAPRVAIVCDLAEENWASMDLVGLMLEEGLREFEGAVEVIRLCPPMRRRFTNADCDEPKLSFNADRILNRFWDYPRWLGKQRDQFDLFHIVDHSYSQLVHHLPADRTVVTCHDLDAFRSVLQADQEQRSCAFRAMTRHTLRGFRKAARITCDSLATKNDILAHGLIDPDRLTVVTNGVHPSCSPKPDPESDEQANRLLGARRTYDLLHVGTTIPRKRVDVLIEILARVRRRIPEVRLIRVGGPFTAEQTALIRRLDITDAIVELPHLERKVLASVYRRANLVLLPSEREGFGLPLAEAMACGTAVVASDLPVLREVGGDAAEYCAVGNIENWADRITWLLTEFSSDRESWKRRREHGIRQASHFTWAEYARRMAAIYSELLGISAARVEIAPAASKEDIYEESSYHRHNRPGRQLSGRTSDRSGI